MHIQEFFATLENSTNDASFLGSLRTLATSLVEQASQGFADDLTLAPWGWPGGNGATSEA